MSTVEGLSPFHVILNTPPGGLCQYLCPEDLAALASVDKCAQNALSLIREDKGLQDQIFNNRLIQLENDNDLFTYMESICCKCFLSKGMLNAVSSEQLYRLWTKSLTTPSLITESILASKKAKIIEVNLNWDFIVASKANNSIALQAIFNSLYGNRISRETLQNALGVAYYSSKQRATFKAILNSKYVTKISASLLGYCLYTSLKYHPREIYQTFLDSRNSNKFFVQTLGQILKEASRSSDCATVQEILDFPCAERISTKTLISAVASAVGQSDSIQRSACIQIILNSPQAEKMSVEELMDAMSSACRPLHLGELKTMKLDYPQFILNSPLVYKLSTLAFYANFTAALFDSTYRISAFIHTSRLFILLGVFACYDIMVLSQTRDMLSSSFLPVRIFSLLLYCPAQFYASSLFWKVRWTLVSEIFDRFRREVESKLGIIRIQ